MQHLDSNLVVQIRPDCPMILFIFIPDQCTQAPSLISPSLICVSTVCQTLWVGSPHFIYTVHTYPRACTHVRAYVSTYIPTCMYMYLFLSDFTWSVPRVHYRSKLAYTVLTLGFYKGKFVIVRIYNTIHILLCILEVKQAV